MMETYNIKQDLFNSLNELCNECIKNTKTILQYMINYFEFESFKFEFIKGNIKFNEEFSIDKSSETISTYLILSINNIDIKFLITIYINNTNLFSIQDMHRSGCLSLNKYADNRKQKEFFFEFKDIFISNYNKKLLSNFHNREVIKK